MNILNRYRIFWIALLVPALLFGCKGKESVVGKKGKSGQKTELTETELIALQTTFLDAKKQLILGNTEEAIPLFQRCLKINPEHAASMYELARISDRADNPEEAILLMEKVVEIAPDNEWYNLLLGVLYRKTAQYDKAISIYNDLIDDFPKKLDYMREKAQILVFMGKIEDAVNVLNEVEAKSGYDEGISMQKIDLYIRLKDTEHAVGEMEKIIQKNPDNPAAYNQLADLYLSQNNRDKAMETYERLLSRDPKNPEIHLSLADLYKREGAHEKSLESLKVAFASSELQVEAKLQILLTYYQFSEQLTELRPEAMELCELVVLAHPEDAMGHALHGDFLLREGENEKAREKYRIATKLSPDKLALWEKLFLTESRMRDYKALVDETAEAIELFPTQPRIYYMNGIARAELEQYEKSIEILSLGVELVVDDYLLKSQFYTSMGDAAHSMKDDALSDKFFEKALQYDPHNVFVLNNYSYYLALRGENLDRAVELSSLCVSLQPNSPSYLDTHGWVLFRQGKFVEAEAALKKALDHGGAKSGVILEHYGDVLYKLDRVDEALDYWKKAADTKEGSDQLQHKIETKQLHD